MQIERFVLPNLGHASYLVVDTATGDALLVDPRRDVDVYVDWAREHDVRIALVADTHGHNDYLSGVSAILGATDARAIAPVGMDVGYAATTPADGDVIELGDLAIEVLHTPGHTPEHTSFVVRERGDVGAPTLLSGGSLLVGDVGRPDLLGNDAEISAAAAAQLGTILDRVLALPGDTRVLPTHVAGSLCAGSIGAELETTVGREAATSRVIAAMRAEREGGAPWLDRDLLPPVPRYWPRMRAQNVAGVAPLTLPERLPELDADQLLSMVAAGATVLDTRPWSRFATRHVAGALLAEVDGSFPTWAGCVLEPTGDVVLLAARERDTGEALRSLARVGLKGGVVGWVREQVLGSWQRAGGATQVLEVVDALDPAAGQLVDVRSPLEVRESGGVDRTWGDALHAVNVPATIATREPQLVPSGPVVLACVGGARAAVVAAVLQRAGRDDVRVLSGDAGAGAVSSALAARSGA